MRWTMRLTASFLDRVRADLRRPHTFAGERMGFVFCRVGNRGGSELLLLATDFDPVLDDEYVEDDTVGARFSGDAYRRAMQRARSDGLGIFLTHEHEHEGKPFFSSVDIEAVDRALPGFRAMDLEQAHGALLLSKDSLNCLCWLPGQTEPERSGRIVVVGRPLRSFSVEVRYGRRLPLKTELPGSTTS